MKMRFVLKAVGVSCAMMVGSSLAQRPCNEVISTATAGELRSLAEVFAQVYTFAGSTTDAEEIASAVDILASPIQFDVVISKICSSCDDAFGVAPPAVCEPGTYGADATYSALAFHPLDEDGRVLNGDLNGQMTLLSTRLLRDMAPTIAYPDSISALLGAINSTYAGSNNELMVALSDVFHSLMTASAGGIGMIFDSLGTGESEGLYDRSWGIKLPVQQGALVTWKAVQDYTIAATDGCTTLQNRTFLYGFSLGAHHAMWASQALQEFGVEIVQGFIQAGPYDMESLFAFTLFNQVNLGLELDPVAVLAATVILASYSNPDATNLPNAVSGPYWVADSWRNSSDISRNIPEWWFGEEQGLEVLFSYLQPPEVRVTIFNEAFVEASLESVNEGIRPCDEELITPETELLCQAIRENADVYPLIFETLYPIQTCHSPSDEVVPSLTTGILPTTGLITPYEPPFPFMEPNSNHVNSQVMCYAGISIWIGENPDYFVALPVEEGFNGRNCSATLTPTVLPSVPPSFAPATAPVTVTSSPTALASVPGGPEGTIPTSPAPDGGDAPDDASIPSSAHRLPLLTSFALALATAFALSPFQHRK